MDPEEIERERAASIKRQQQREQEHGADLRRSARADDLAARLGAYGKCPRFCMNNGTVETVCPSSYGNDFCHCCETCRQKCAEQAEAFERKVLGVMSRLETRRGA